MATPTQDHDLTIIGAGTRIKGEVAFDRSARILGTFEGTITSAAQVHVGDSAEITGTVHADTIIVDGIVNGDLIALSRLELAVNARVSGDITAGNLVVAEGASFEGHCRVGAVATGEADDRQAATPSQAGTQPTSQLEPKPEVTTRLRATTARPSARPAWVEDEAATQPGARAS